MISAKYLKVKYPYDNMVMEEHPIQFGAVVQSSWSERLALIYLTGTYKDGRVAEKERWYMQGHPLVDGVPYKMGCLWFNDLGERNGDMIECFHKNPEDEVRVLWEPEETNKQMEMKL